MTRKQIYHWRGGPLTLVALLGVWLGQPTPTSFALGTALCALGEGLRFWAIGFTGGPTRGIVLEAPRLISAGPYAHVRNPLYVGNLLNGTAIVVASAGGLGGFWAGLLIGLASQFLWRFYRLIIDIEEQFLGDCFVDEYREYCRVVPRLLPNWKAAGPRQGSFSLDRAMFFEKSTLFWCGLVWTLIFLKVCA